MIGIGSEIGIVVDIGFVIVIHSGLVTVGIAIDLMRVIAIARRYCYGYDVRYGSCSHHNSCYCCW